MKTILVIIGLVTILAAVYYFGFYKKGKINDRDGDLIPDEVEDAVEDVKKVAKEVKRRAKNVKQELKDVADATKEVLNQAGDVAAAAKGKTRRGRKPRRSSKKK
jgi:F0F1-type ATP synthase membrane subunit b/b'